MTISVCRMYHQLFFVSFYNFFQLGMIRLLDLTFPYYGCDMKFNYYTTVHSLQVMMQTIYRLMTKQTFYNALHYTFGTLRNTYYLKEHIRQLKKFVYSFKNNILFSKFYTLFYVEFKSIFLTRMLFNLHRYAYPLDYDSFRLLSYNVFHASFKRAYSTCFANVFTLLKKNRKQCIAYIGMNGKSKY